MSEADLTNADRRFAARRGEARLAAVQALYQLEMGGRGVEAVLREFLDHRLPAPDQDGAAETVDADHFAALVRGVVAAQGDIDQAVSRVLAEGWRLKRIDATARAILRAGAYEILDRPDIPAGAIVESYLAVADAFFDGTEQRFIHAALDALIARAPARGAGPEPVEPEPASPDGADGRDG